MNRARPGPVRVRPLICIVALLFMAGCGDGSAGSPVEAPAVDAHDAALLTLLSDPLITDVAAAVDDAALRRALRPTGDVGSVRGLLAGVDRESLSAYDQIAVSVLELTVRAAESGPVSNTEVEHEDEGFDGAGHDGRGPGPASP